MPKNLELKGLVFAFAAMFLFNVSDAAWKYALQFFSEPTVVLVFCVCASLGIYGYARITKTSLAYHSKRNIIIFAALLLVSTGGFAMALKLMPIAQLFVILLITPLCILVASRVFLGEKLSHLQTISLLIGFSGALVAVVTPVLLEGTSNNQPLSLWGVFFTLMCVSSNVIRGIFMRRMAMNENPLAMTLGAYILIGLVYIAPALTTHISSPDITPLVIVGICSLSAAAGMILFMRAFQMARAGLAGAAQYSQMVWSALIGVFIFNEPLTGPTLLGAFLVVTSGLFLVMATLKGQES